MAKKLILAVMVLFVLASLPFVSCVGASSELWSKTYGRTYDAYAYSVVETSDGGFAVAGAATFPVGFLLVRTNANGYMLWDRVYGGKAAYCVIETSDGGFALAGGSLMVKTDDFGDEEWNLTIFEGSIRSLVQTPDGGYALAGWKDSVDNGYENYEDALLVKTDAQGNIEWKKTFGGAEDDWVNSLVQTSDGGFALVGRTRSFDGRIWLIKTDAQGNMLWNRTHEGAEVYSLVATSDGGYAFAGYSGATNFGGNSNFWLGKTDEYGNMLWNKTYDKNLAEIGESLIETSDGGFALVGVTYSNTVREDFWLVKTDANGNMEWNQTYGGEQMDWPKSVTETSDGGYALAGDTRSVSGGADFWLVKTDAQGIPEFPSYTVIPLLLIASFTAIICRQRLLKKSANSLN